MFICSLLCTDEKTMALIKELKCILKHPNRKSPRSDKWFIHLFTLNCMKNLSGLSLTYLHFIPKLGENLKRLSLD